jgi:hypothetical protein
VGASSDVGCPGPAHCQLRILRLFRDRPGGHLLQRGSRARGEHSAPLDPDRASRAALTMPFSPVHCSRFTRAIGRLLSSLSAPFVLHALVTLLAYSAARRVASGVAACV